MAVGATRIRGHAAGAAPDDLRAVCARAGGGERRARVATGGFRFCAAAGAERAISPAAVPITLASVQDQIEPGQRVLCMGIGSGLNTSFSEILW